MVFFLLLESSRREAGVIVNIQKSLLRLDVILLETRLSDIAPILILPIFEEDLSAEIFALQVVPELGLT